MKIAALALAAMVAVQAPQSADAVLARLDTYLADYEPKLSEIIADETMTQSVSRSARKIGAPENDLPVVSREQRKLESEVAFVALPNDVGWLGFRHVTKVNDRAVKDADLSLTSALRATSLDSARALLASSAEHNLGLPRTNNLPNLPLEFLHKRNRLRFVSRLNGTERIQGIDTVRLVLEERVRPTLIRNQFNDRDMPSTIRVWVNPQSGELIRAEVTTFTAVEAKTVSGTVRVDFSRNKALELLVPTEMRERFPASDDATGESQARYQNFRRFTTSARIVPQ
jgi:hypothetical protein